MIIKLKETDSTFKKLLKACYVTIHLEQYNTTDIHVDTPSEIVSPDVLSSITSGTKHLLILN